MILLQAIFCCHIIIQKTVSVEFPELVLYFQAQIQGRWNGWIFTPPFSEPLSFFLFSYPSNIEITFDFSDIITKIHPPFQNRGSALGWICLFQQDTKNGNSHSRIPWNNKLPAMCKSCEEDGVRCFRWEGAWMRQGHSTREIHNPTHSCQHYLF